MKDKTKLGYVYKIILDIPEPHVVYVGSTTQSPTERLSHHAAIQKHPTKLNRLIRSIGKEHFSIEVLEYVANYDIRLMREEVWTRVYKNDPDNCNECIGAIKSDNMKERARETNYRNRNVVCDNDDKVFISCSEAARYYGLCQTDISECCARHLKQTKGYRFRYEDEDKSLYLTYWNSDGIYRNRRILCVETGVVYDNCVQAATAVGVHHTSIKRCCVKNGVIRKLNLHFVFAE